MTWRIASQQLISSYYGEFENDFYIDAIEYICKWMISKELKFSVSFIFPFPFDQFSTSVWFDVLNIMVFMETHDKIFRL